MKAFIGDRRNSRAGNLETAQNGEFSAKSQQFDPPHSPKGKAKAKFYVRKSVMCSYFRT
jgi:hypothetical protein